MRLLINPNIIIPFSTKKIVAIFLFFMMFVLTTFTNTSSAQSMNNWDITSPLTETRAVWLTTIGGLDWPKTKNAELQKKELCDILDKLKKANINTILLQTRIRGTVIYPSAIEPWDDCITGRSGKFPGYDPLQYAIEECHKRGMELHAWIVCIPLGKLQKQKALGAESILRQNPKLCKTVKGECFMIPGNPETANYIAKLCGEITEKYDIDGIHLDYIRYPESSYGFSDINMMLPKYRNKDEWRRENITRIVQRISEKVKSIKPWIKMSCSPIGKYNDLSRYSSKNWNCFSAVYQDPVEWLRNGYMDELFPMMYFQGDHFYPFLYNWNEVRGQKPVIPGLGIYFLDPREGRWELNDVRAEIFAIRKTGIGGIAFYRSDFLTRNCKGLLSSISDEFFVYPSLTQRLVYDGDTIAPSMPEKVYHTMDSLKWTPCTDNTTNVLYNVYASHNYPVDVTTPSTLIAARVQQTSLPITGRMSADMHFAIIAIDRFGNESHAAQEDTTNISRSIDPYKIVKSELSLDKLKVKAKEKADTKKKKKSKRKK